MGRKMNEICVMMYGSMLLAFMVAWAGGYLFVRWLSFMMMMMEYNG